GEPVLQESRDRNPGESDAGGPGNPVRCGAAKPQLRQVAGMNEPLEAMSTMTTAANLERPESSIGRAPGRAEDGIALIIAMMAMLLLSALGLALVLTTSTETMIAGNYSTSHEGLYAADAIPERTMDDLLTVPDWNRIPDR